MKQVQSDYTVGIDIGTNSIGYAAIGESYKVLSKGDKKIWGVYLIDPGMTAVDRRVARTTRRRMVRRHDRVVLLRELMQEMVLSQDESFFIKLQKSSFLTVAKDKDTGRDNDYNLFNDVGFTDKEYYHDYKTIYHLRDTLMNSSEKADARLIYLALHHAIKYRGNFLHEGEKLSEIGGNLSTLLEEYFAKYDELMQSAIEDYDINLSNEINADSVLNILRDKTITKTDRVDKIKSLYNKKEVAAIAAAHASALLGKKTSLEKLFVNLDIEEAENKKDYELDFSKADCEEKEAAFLTALGDMSELLVLLKDIYSTLMFETVKKGEKTISQAMIKQYALHAEHLKKLKRALHALGNEEYHKMFYPQAEKSSSYNNYARYSKRKCNYEDFAKYVESILKQCEQTTEVVELMQAINKEEFMPLQVSVLNSYIPYQFNENEVATIIDNQKRYYPELAENRDKIISILTFRRPYFVGPLNSAKGKSQFSWIEEQIKERVYPWNFSELVDYEKAQHAFIDNLTNSCSYFKDQKVLAKQSITYQMYEMLNELNKIKLKKMNISHDIKMLLFDKLCKEQVSISVKAIVKCINDANHFEYRAEDVSGFAGEGKLVATMSSYRAFKRIFGESFSEKNVQQYDAIIELLTIFDDKKTRASLLRKAPYNLDESIINQLKGMRLSGWGRFSNKLLNGVLGDNKKTILQTMLDTEFNFMEIVWDESLGFKEKIKAKTEEITKFSYKDHIEELYCSPPVKKLIWNTLKIIQEIERVMGYPPKHIFIENTETDQKKKKTKTRAQKIKEAYALVKKDSEHNDYWSQELEEGQEKAKNEITKLDDKFYLWLLQMGRCMYTGETISYDSVGECEIDHIVPQCYIKDNSVENRVLVKKIENQQKTDTLALSVPIRSHMRPLWSFLLKNNLMGKKKYFNLIKDEYDDKDKARFIDRQLVETNQIIRAVRELLDKKYPAGCVQGIRADLSRTLRKKGMEQGWAGFYKIRSLNDLHHAKDAYLAAVLGQFTTVAFRCWGKENKQEQIKFFITNGNADFRATLKLKYGVIINAMDRDFDREGEYLWNNNYYNNMIKQMSYNDINVVKQKMFKAATGFFRKIQYRKKGDGKLIPKKFVVNNAGIVMPLNTQLYGGYTDSQKEYFCIVKYNDKKGREQKELVGVTVMNAYRIRQGKTTLEHVCQEWINDDRITNLQIVKYVYCDQLIDYEYEPNKWHKLTITSEVYKSNAVQLKVDSKFDKLLYYVARYVNAVVTRNIKQQSECTKELSVLFESGIGEEFILHHAEKLEKYYPVYARYAQESRNSVEVFSQAELVSKIEYINYLLLLTQSKSTQIKPPKGYLPSVTHGMIVFKLDLDKTVFVDQSITGLYSAKTKGSDL